MRRSLPVALLGAAVVGWMSPAAAASDPSASDEIGIEYFESRVRPLLAERCFRCHGEKKQKSGLRLDSPAAILRGGDSGAVIETSEPSASAMLLAVRYADELLQMPPKRKLADEELAVLEKWFEMGVPLPAVDPDHFEERPLGPKNFDLEERGRHWSFQPLRDVGPGAGATEGNAIDAFIDARLRREGLRRVGPAERSTWLRRATFDLTGLPPSWQEVEAFETDSGPDAHEKVIDRLLASPHFGERWARHWLDLVRYAESRGHEFDFDIPNAHEYRDYVIRAFNADLPYDRFVTEQVAGDLLEAPRLHPEHGWNESVLGTGFWYLGEATHSPVDIRADEVDRIANQVDVFSKAFLGLTVACARCHDHMFDPIPTTDFYALSGFVLSSAYRQVRFETMERNGPIARRLARIDAEIGPRLGRLVGEQLEASVDGLGAELVAAVESLARGPAPPGESLENPKDREPEVEGEQAVPLEPLHAWLLEARSDPHDPLYPFASSAFESEADSASGSAGDIPPAESGASQELPEGARVLVDFSTRDARGWTQDGFTFRQVQVGEVQPGPDSSRPIVRVSDRTAVAADPTWDILKTAAGNDRDPNAIKWDQAGRTLFTRTFTLSGRRLFHLVRGRGHVFASVDSHRIIHGPLHGALVRHLGDDKSPIGWRWEEQDLRDYAGQRCHLEYSPHLPGGEVPPPSDFAVAMVIESDQAPAPIVPDHAGLRARLAGAASVEERARACEEWFRDAARALAAGELTGVPHGPEQIRSVNRLLGLDLPAADVAVLLSRRTGCLEQVEPISATGPAMIDCSGVDEHVLARGNHRTPKELAPRRFLAVADGFDPLPIVRGSGRLELARRLCEADSPFLSRTIANRVWHHLFGRGLVPSVDDFGVMGEAPSHPELLDHLALGLMRDGWSLKRLIRRIMLSETYRMSSVPAAEGIAKDPANRLLHQFPVRRLSGEAIRDAVLSISGRLDQSLFGRSVPVHLTSFMQGRGRPGKSGPVDGDGRRSLYLAVRRNFLTPFLLAFDYPIPATTMGRRSVSNVPAQSLALMNDPLLVEQAALWARRAAEEGPVEPAVRVDWLYRQAFSRRATGAEISAALLFLATQSERYSAVAAEGDEAGGPITQRVWADLCHVLLNGKEFLFLR